MSFILDALKKSENERKRSVGPSLVDAPLRRQQGDRPWWAVAVGALLMVNLGVLLAVLIRRDDTPDTAPLAAPPATPAQIANSAPRRTAPLPSQTRAAGDPSVHSLADEAAGYGEDRYQDAPPPERYDPRSPGLAAAANVPAGPPIVRPIDAPAVAPLPSAPRGSYSSNAASTEVLPTLSSLVASGTSLPELRLDIHVYSGKPADRFAFVNMRKYQEGQTLTEGPTLERITPEGVVLNSQGQRFLLPRQ
jgi:general secretion pathway protein B